MARNPGIATLGKWASLAVVVAVVGRSSAMTINPTYNDAAMLAAGLTAGQVASVHTAFASAAAQLTSNFTDAINVNINVTTVGGVGTLGSSNTFLNSFSYAAMQAKLVADRSTADDNTAVLSGGSAFTTTDPVGGSHAWWVTTAQAKSLGLIADNLSTDGTFTFGAGFTYDFDPTNGVTSGAFDFQGIALHEITEIMGRIPGLGTTAFNGTPAYMLFDLFRYTGAGARGLTNGAGVQFSIDGGTNLLKVYNNASVFGGDSQDWASGTNDSFNAFSSSGVVNPMTAVDLRVMDVIGYNRASAIPEPSTAILLGSALLVGALIGRRAKLRP